MLPVLLWLLAAEETESFFFFQNQDREDRAILSSEQEYWSKKKHEKIQPKHQEQNKPLQIIYSEKVIAILVFSGDFSLKNKIKKKIQLTRIVQTAMHLRQFRKDHQRLLFIIHYSKRRKSLSLVFKVGKKKKSLHRDRVRSVILF